MSLFFHLLLVTLLACSPAWAQIEPLHHETLLLERRATLSPPTFAVRYYSCDQHAAPSALFSPLPMVPDLTKQIMTQFHCLETIFFDPDGGILHNLKTSEVAPSIEKWHSALTNDIPEGSPIVQLILYTGHGYMHGEADRWKSILAFFDGQPDSPVAGRYVHEMIHLLKSRATAQRPCLLILDACQKPPATSGDVLYNEALPSSGDHLWIYYTARIGQTARAGLFQQVLRDELAKIGTETTSVPLGVFLSLLDTALSTRSSGVQGLIAAKPQRGHNAFTMPQLLRLPPTQLSDELSTASASSIDHHHLATTFTNSHDIGTPQFIAMPDLKSAASHYLEASGVKTGRNFIESDSKLGKFTLPKAKYKSTFDAYTCASISDSPFHSVDSDTVGYVSQNVSSRLVSLLSSQTSDLKIEQHLFLERDTTIQCKDLRIAKGVHITTNGFALNLKVYGDLHCEDLELRSFTAARAGDGLPGGGDNPNIHGFNGKSAGGITLAVMGKQAKGSIRAQLKGMGGGKGGADGGNGGEGGDGAILMLTLPPDSKDSLKVTTSDVSGGSGGTANAPFTSGSKGEDGKVLFVYGLPAPLEPPKGK